MIQFFVFRMINSKDFVESSSTLLNWSEKYFVIFHLVCSIMENKLFAADYFV
jgi:hypothetical protein